MNGFLVIDKPGGMTSRDVVNAILPWFPRKTKIGHTGTLDPLATGVLVIGIGAATRLADYVQAMSKSYSSVFRLGAISSTDDVDGAITECHCPSPAALADITRALESFQGMVQQVPPAISAVKVSGQRAYHLARAGNEVQLSPREVRIDAIRLRHYEWPYLHVEVDCGKGTYIRSIARDLGARLGCGGLVQSLRRTRIGPFIPEMSIPFSADASGQPKELDLIPLIAAVENLPKAKLSPEEARRARLGQTITFSGNELGTGADSREVALLDPAGNLMGIGECSGSALRPRMILRL